MEVINRLYRVGQAEIRSITNTINKQLKMHSLHKHEMNTMLTKCIDALAEIKINIQKSAKAIQQYKIKAVQYLDKAKKLVELGKTGQIDEAESDRLANYALKKQIEMEKQMKMVQHELESLDNLKSQLERTIENLRNSYLLSDDNNKLFELSEKLNNAVGKLNEDIETLSTLNTEISSDYDYYEPDIHSIYYDLYNEYVNDISPVDIEIEKALKKSAPFPSPELEELKRKIEQQQKDIDNLKESLNDTVNKETEGNTTEDTK